MVASGPGEESQSWERLAWVGEVEEWRGLRLQLQVVVVVEEEEEEVGLLQLEQGPQQQV